MAANGAGSGPPEGGPSGASMGDGSGDTFSAAAAASIPGGFAPWDPAPRTPFTLFRPR